MMAAIPDAIMQSISLSPDFHEADTKSTSRASHTCLKFTQDESFSKWYPPSSPSFVEMIPAFFNLAMTFLTLAGLVHTLDASASLDMVS